ncbi:MAG: alanine--tRNA ligase [Gemmatimonadota bacterium]|nr:MAG: alanine--tRNA ligase [Gemmatimonadota bacterium]
MTSSEIRQSFLDFFAKKDHKILPSAPVIPEADPTLLFTNAGMNQFKDIFLGMAKRTHTRVANTQKCIRVSGKHNDLEEVGRDTYHHTFFEMLGNWSFGDYYKEEAILWAWELLTEVWRLPKEKLWATVFREDDEAARLWTRVTDIPADRVLRFDEKDNFWEMGEVGPCGPCSEIHFDRGEAFCDAEDPDHTCGVNSGCARYIELWNLVFIQYNRDESGTQSELPAKHVDTGAGFERIVSVLENSTSNYDTDLFRPITDEISDITGKSYADGQTESDVAFRVLSDHVRALSFAIADGAMPSNEGRGYVLRRILRRGARFGRILDMHEPFIYRLVSPLVDVMGQAFPEIKERHQHIARVIQAEEENFGRTLDRGIAIFEERAQKVLQAGKTVFPGEDAFLLHDTYGFPLDLTQLMAREKGLTVDENTFESDMERQKELSKKGQKEIIQVTSETPIQSQEFVGYDNIESEAEVILMSKGNAFVEEAHQGEEVDIELDNTPFYGEYGGQVGDTGTLSAEGLEVEIIDAQRAGKDRIVHQGRIKNGQLQKGRKVLATVDLSRRKAIARNHTATHLLQAALRHVLGDHISQAGSLVAPDRLRFDFTHYAAMTDEEIEQVESIVNRRIIENLPVSTTIKDFDEAKKGGAIALFGEKYDEHVRVVEAGDFSAELCGGTHVGATGEIGLFLITSESAVAAGVRRIEALTGEGAYLFSKKRNTDLEIVARLLKANPSDVKNRVEKIIRHQKELEDEVQKLRLKQSDLFFEDLINRAVELEGIKIATAEVETQDIDSLRKMADILRDKLGSGVGVLGTAFGEKVTFIVVVTDNVIRERGLKAGEIVKRVAKITGGGGGGKDRLAQAGGKDPAKLKEALSQAPAIVKEMLDGNR